MNLTAFQTFLQNDKVYNPSEILDVLKQVRPNFRLAWTNRKERYFDVPAAFDIETSSFFQTIGNEQEKVAIMYEWTFGIFGAVIIGRTWKEFTTLIETLVDELNLNIEKRLVIYVHNLGYEFQFFRKYFVWEKVFSIKNRTPIYAVTNTGIEFRCSYILSGYNLAKVAENLHSIEIKKLTGELDYSKIRHSETPLTKQEIAYCVNDVKIVMTLIAERIEDSGKITKIPYTKTGYVREFCRNACFYTDEIAHKKDIKKPRYREILKRLTLDADEYKQLKRAFQGGFTHANAFYSGKELKDVDSYDFVSSYPCVMLAEKYPMSKAELVDVSCNEELEHNLKLYCCLFDIQFNGLQSKILQENYLSISRCYGVKKAVTNNGRVVCAESICTTLTEQDYRIMKYCYNWESVKIVNFRRYKRGYLPTDFIKAILKLYESKTTLKGVDGKEAEYLQSKEMLNSCYGMCVTDIVRNDIIYDGENWKEETPDITEKLEKYNNAKNRFLFYPWGVWVTAYARKNLWTGIKEFGLDYIYSDTDSIKAINADKHLEYIENYNKIISNQLERALQYHGIDKNAIRPKTIKGIEKPLGIWEHDGRYKRFKTLGAKRYMVEDENGNINITVSGLNKKVCVPYLVERYGDKVFQAFSENLYVPAGKTGKMTHTYIDEIRRGIITDYKGTPLEYKELSCVHLENTDYSLSIAQEYADYLKGLEE